MNLVAALTTVAGVSAFAAAGLFGPERLVMGRCRPDRDRPGTRRSRLSLPRRRVPPVAGASGGTGPFGVGGPLSGDRGRGSARWATHRDLRPLLTAPVRGPGVGPPGRLVLGWTGRRLVSAERAQSVIVFGPTQSHKTSGFAVPAILGWEGPVIATSIKTDLIDHTIDHRRSLGVVQCFDPSDSTGIGSVSWSPLPAARTWPGARRAAAGLTEGAKASVGTMSDGDFWYATATKMLAPLLFAAAFGGHEMTEVVRWVDTQEETEVLDLLAAAGVPEATHAAWSLFGKEDRQRSSIYTTVETILEPFAGLTSPDLTQGHLLADPAQLIEGENTLFLCAPAHDQRRLTPLFAAVVRQAIEHVYDRVARTHRPLDHPLLIVLDEAANIAPLPDLDALASTAAGHGVQLVTVWHDMAQITARYGPRATTVVNNHRAKLFLSGISDPSTLDYASHLIGDEDVLLPATTMGGQGGPSTTRSPAVRRLAPPDTLRRIAPGEAVLVYGGLPPARLRLRTWFSEPALRDRATAGAATAT